MSKLKKYISQTQCQIKSFKIQIKIFVIIISVLLLSCDYNKNKESKNGINYIDVEFERFEKKFFNSSLDIKFSEPFNVKAYSVSFLGK